MAQRLGDVFQQSLGKQVVVRPLTPMPNAPPRHYATGALGSAALGLGALLSFLASIMLRAPLVSTLSFVGELAMIIGPLAMARAWIGVREDRGGWFAIIGSFALPTALIGAHFIHEPEQAVQCVALGFLAFVIGHVLARAIHVVARVVAVLTTCFMFLTFHFATHAAQTSTSTLMMLILMAFAGLAGLGFVLSIDFAITWSIAGGLARRVNPSARFASDEARFRCST